ncbi:MAG TPA: hypothetical protein VIX83_07640 [Candidatus Cybelea sp.]
MHWLPDWAWGIPLIVVTVIVQSFALFGARNRMIATVAKHYDEEAFSLVFGFAMGAVVLFATFLLAVEAAFWAVVYVTIGALPDFSRAMLYSLEAMTTFGHADVYLTAHWQFLGALEALNGVILIGLTTAFIFSVLRGAELRWKERR